MAFQASAQFGLWFDQADQARLSSRLKRMLVLSLVFHVVVVLVAAGIRFPRQGERPLTSVEVSLVSLPTPTPPKQAEPTKAIESAKVPDPKHAPAPPGKALSTSVTHSPAHPIGEKRRDILQDLQLPPDAPKFGDLTPTIKPAAQPQQVAKVQKRSTVSDELDRELEEELK